MAKNAVRFAPLHGLLLLVLFVLSPLCAAELESPGVRILEGSLKKGETVDLDFVGDEDDFGRASLPVHGISEQSISATEVMSELGPALRKQAIVYARAQLAAGSRTRELLPLHVILDPAGSWAYAYTLARFRYRYLNRWVGPMSCPALVMGMDTSYAKPTSSKNAGTEERNRKMLALLGPWFAETIGSSKGGQEDLEKALKRWTLTMDDGSKRNVLDAVAHASCKSYLGWLRQIVVSDLMRRNLDGEALWAACPHGEALDALVLENQLVGVRERLAETVAHEMGHLIHFTAAGSNHVNLGGYAPHMNGTSHQLTTLSNEEFAFVEGWAEANAFVVMGNAEDLSGPANRIDYANTVEVVRKKLNEAFGRAVGQAVHQRGYLAPSTPFTVLPWETDHEAFMAGIRKNALDLGMGEKEFDRLVKETSEDQEVAQLLRVDTFVGGLQARKGELKSRYDYLRSERSVAHVLAHLRLRMGEAVNARVLEILAEEQSRGGKPDTLAEVLESYAHRFPEERFALYEALAEITEGILIRPAELSLMSSLATHGYDLEIDLDRDGWVPGGAAANANVLYPTAFLAEASPMEDCEDPLNFGGKRNEVLVPMLSSIPLEDREQGETPVMDTQQSESLGRWARSDEGRVLFPVPLGEAICPAPSLDEETWTDDVDGATDEESETGDDETTPLWDDLNRN